MMQYQNIVWFFGLSLPLALHPLNYHFEDKKVKHGNLILPSDAYSIAIDNRNQYIFVYCQNAGIYNVDFKNRVVEKKIQLPNELIPEFVFSKNLRFAALTGENPRIIDLKNGTTVFQLKKHDKNMIHAAALSKTGKFGAFGGTNGEIYLVNLTTKKIVQVFNQLESNILSLAISNDDSFIIAGVESSDGFHHAINLWNIERKTKDILYGHKGMIVSLSVNKDGEHFASSSGDRTIIIWSLKNKKKVTELKGHLSGVFYCGFSDSGQLLASAGTGFDKTIKIWDWKNKRIKAEVIGLKRDVLSVAFMGENRIVYAAAEKKTEERCYVKSLDFLQKD